MTIDYTQVGYSEKQKENFPSEMEGNPVLISLDSIKINGIHGKDYINPEDAVKDYLLRQFDSKQLGTYYNWFIDRNGSLYHITPDNKAGHSCVFSLYSTRMSVALPTMCPQHKVDVTDMNNIPDKKIISICTELPDNEKDQYQITPSQEHTLQNLLAYYMKETGIKPKDIMCRSAITRREIEKEILGHKAYKDNITQLVILTSYALMISRKESDITLHENKVISMD